MKKILIVPAAVIVLSGLNVTGASAADLTSGYDMKAAMPAQVGLVSGSIFDRDRDEVRPGQKPSPKQDVKKSNAQREKEMKKAREQRERDLRKQQEEREKRERELRKQREAREKKMREDQRRKHDRKPGSKVNRRNEREWIFNRGGDN